MTRALKTRKSEGKAGTSSRLQKYLANALAPNTVQAYLSDLRHFRSWGGRIPATPGMVARYLADCAGQVKPSTLRRRIAAIASAHTILQKASPTRSELVQTTLRGIRRVHGTAQKQAKPISIAMLRHIVRPRKDLDLVRDLRDRTLLVVGFAGGFRRSELVSLTLGSLTFGVDGVEVMLKRSKTDPSGKGRVVAIPPGPSRLCPVRLLKSWLAVLRKEDIAAEAMPLFRAVDRHGQLQKGLRGAAVGGILRERLRHCGLECDGYSAHSLRSGLVTSAAKAGVPVWAIQRQTGHRSESTVHRYIRGLSSFEANAFRAVVK